MLIAHHWLGFIPLMVLISSTFAAPTATAPTSILYRVTVLYADGKPLERVARPVQTRINNFITLMGPKLEDEGAKSMKYLYQLPALDPKKEPELQDVFDPPLGYADDPRKTVYLEFIGGTFCKKGCYAYLVTTGRSKDANNKLPTVLHSTDNLMRLGAIIAKTGIPWFIICLIGFPHNSHAVKCIISNISSSWIILSRYKVGSGRGPWSLGLLLRLQTLRLREKGRVGFRVRRLRKRRIYPVLPPRRRIK
ncbi:hypothetical protein BDP27DRAFT_81347 [Rhodocollybia butyracea]|uniref:Uncharacterized protein n=1 Tax=Rhodocollybia butyracea TaxID=206335 RepID=A0A9P5PKY4_9AGAR|nr:hypothetical protein BDP27DRAFT_81347 [Rhodocollybia butyracea]